MISWYQQDIIKLSSRYHDTARVRSVPPIPCIGIGITPIPVSASICCIHTGIIISQYRHLHGWYLYLYCSNGIVVSVFYHYESQPFIGIGTIGIDMIPLLVISYLYLPHINTDSSTCVGIGICMDDWAILVSESVSVWLFEQYRYQNQYWYQYQYQYRYGGIAARAFHSMASKRVCTQW